MKNTKSRFSSTITLESLDKAPEWAITGPAPVKFCPLVGPKESFEKICLPLNQNMCSWNFCTAVVITIGLSLSSCLITSPTFAVVTFEDGSETLADDFGFANVGQKGFASGVYLGDRWVLTARHVGTGDITLNGITYHYEEESAQTIKNPSGFEQLDSVYTDLILYRLTEEPDLPALKIATTPPPIATDLYLAGNGYRRQDSLSYWTVSGTDWVWTESETTTSYWGYKTQDGHELNWGRNQVIASSRGPTDSTHYLTLDSTDMVAIKTRFDVQQPREAQAVSGDSGGGAFYFDNEEGWVLAGIISCIEVPPNSPTYAISEATTCCVDLSFYRDEILEIINPSIIPETIPGDANGDGMVNGADVTIIADNWQQSGSSGPLMGDLNNDGIVDGSDVTILADNWGYCGTSYHSSKIGMKTQNLTPGSTAVPEPASWILLFLAVGSVALLFKRT